MGIGAIVLGGIAWVLVIGGISLHVSHQLSSVGFMIAISGAAVAHEGRRVEQNTSAAQKRLGLWINAAAAVAAVASIGLEVARTGAG